MGIDWSRVRSSGKPNLQNIIYNTVLTNLICLKGNDEYFQASIIADDVEREVKKYIEKYYVEK